MIISFCSCAFHKGKFPYICFRRSCVKAQFDVDGKLHAIKVNRNKRQIKRRRRQAKNDREKPVQEIASAEENHKETAEDRREERRKEKEQKDQEEESRQRRADSVYQSQHNRTRALSSPSADESGDTLIVFFGPGSDSISVPDEERVKSFLEKHKDRAVRMTGSMDEAEAAADRSVSLKRIKKVSALLQGEKVPANKISKTDEGVLSDDRSKQKDNGAARRVMIIAK